MSSLISAVLCHSNEILSRELVWGCLIWGLFMYVGRPKVGQRVASTKFGQAATPLISHRGHDKTFNTGKGQTRAPRVPQGKESCCLFVHWAVAAFPGQPPPNIRNPHIIGSRMIGPLTPLLHFAFPMELLRQRSGTKAVSWPENTPEEWSTETVPVYNCGWKLCCGSVRGPRTMSSVWKVRAGDHIHACLWLHPIPLTGKHRLFKLQFLSLLVYMCRIRTPLSHWTLSVWCSHRRLWHFNVPRTQWRVSRKGHQGVFPEHLRWVKQVCFFPSDVFSSDTA